MSLCFNKIIMLNRYLAVLPTPAMFENFVKALNSAITSLDAELVLFSILVEGIKCFWF